MKLTTCCPPLLLLLIYLNQAESKSNSSVMSIANSKQFGKSRAFFPESCALIYPEVLHCKSLYDSGKIFQFMACENCCLKLAKRCDVSIGCCKIFPSVLQALCDTVSQIMAEFDSIKMCSFLPFGVVNKSHDERQSKRPSQVTSSC